MKNSIEKYISELLFQNDCVIVPDFGGFICNDTPSEINEKTNSITPPSKHILFNVNLKSNDGLLITHIAKKENISQNEAKNEVYKFSNDCNNKLSTSKILRLDKIGLFTLSNEKNVFFIQDKSTNYRTDSFGLNTTYPKKIKRVVSTTDEIKNNTKIIKSEFETKKLVLKAAAVLIPLITFAFISLTQQDKITSMYDQMASLSPFENKQKTVDYKNKKIDKKDTNIKVDKVQNSDVIKQLDNKATKEENLEKKLPINSIEKHNNYYIIAGAFAEKKNAIKMQKKLNKWNYKSEILSGGRLIRVSYNSFKSRDEAVVALNSIRKENPEAWLLSK